MMVTLTARAPDLASKRKERRSNWQSILHPTYSILHTARRSEEQVADATGCILCVAAQQQMLTTVVTLQEKQHSGTPVNLVEWQQDKMHLHASSRPKGLL